MGLGRLRPLVGRSSRFRRRRRRRRALHHRPPPTDPPRASAPGHHHDPALSLSRSRTRAITPISNAAANHRACALSDCTRIKLSARAFALDPRRARKPCVRPRQPLKPHPRSSARDAHRVLPNYTPAGSTTPSPSSQARVFAASSGLARHAHTKPLCASLARCHTHAPRPRERPSPLRRRQATEGAKKNKTQKN